MGLVGLVLQMYDDVCLRLCAAPISQGDVVSAVTVSLAFSKIKHDDTSKNFSHSSFLSAVK